MSKKIRFIGDVHGHYKQYALLCHSAEDKGWETVQIGDMGFTYEHFSQFGLDNGKHHWFGGNHEHYNKYHKAPCQLGDYGTVPIEDWKYSSFLFIRGAHSIDYKYRTEGLDWFRNEELDLKEWRACFDFYKLTRPNIVVTHDCPNIARDEMVKGGFGIVQGQKIQTRTGQMLQHLYDIWQPSLWIFGHWHKDVEFKVGKTKFRCIDILQTFDL